MKDPILRDSDVDLLGEALITLTKELWIVKDRQRVLEAALNDAGILDEDLLDTYQPDETLAGQLDDERKKLIDDVINALTPPPVDASKK